MNISGEKDLQTLLATMRPTLASDEYVFGTIKELDAQMLSKLQPRGTFIEDEGTTVIITKAQADVHGIAYSGVFKCITLLVHSSLEAVGLTAAVATKLSQANISANVVAASYHDHIFVPIDKAELALDTLITLTQ